MKYLIVVEREKDNGDGYDTEVRSFIYQSVLSVDLNLLKEEFKKWLDVWFNETHTGHDNYCTYKIIAAVKVSEELDQTQLESVITDSVSSFRSP